MKVCFVVGTLARGGAEKQLVFMLRALRSAEIETEVFCLTRGESYEEEIRNLGVNVEFVGESGNRAARLFKIINRLRETRADIVQSSHFYTNVYAGAAARILKIPGIGAVRSDLIYEVESHKLTGRWQISLPHFLIVNSRAAFGRLIERGVSPDKIEFVRNAVEITDKIAANGDKNQQLKILFAGRLDRNKRPDRFVRLASILTERFPQLDLQFQIAGDGEMRFELEKTAREFGLTPDKLKFLGVCREMEEIYFQSDILVNTSEREGTPNVVLEAMAHGLAVVATNVGGTAEILDESRGFLIAPNDESALVGAAAKLISDKELRSSLGNRGREYVAQNHSLESLQKHLTKIYERLLAPARLKGKIISSRQNFL
jgi:L-malate glycosyltransferase